MQNTPTVPHRAKFRALVITAGALVVFLSFWQFTNADLLGALLGNNVVSNKYTVHASDVAAGTNVDPATYCGDTNGAQTAGGSCKKVLVFSPAAATFLVSVATKVTTPFAISGTNTDIAVHHIVVEDGSGNQLSSADVALPPSLNAIALENRPGNALERMFYDESNSVRLVYYVYGRNSDSGQAVDLGTLTSGQFDVYSSFAKP